MASTLQADAWALTELQADGGWVSFGAPKGSVLERRDQYGGGVRHAWSRWVLDIGWTKLLDDKGQPTGTSDLTAFGTPAFSITYYRF